MTEVIDARVCPPIPAFLGDRTWRQLDGTLDGVRQRGWTVTESMRSSSVADYLATCKELGFVAAGIAARVPNQSWGGSGNALVFEAANEHPDFFFANAAIEALDPDPGTTIEELRRRGARGIVVEPGLHADVLHIDDPKVFPVYDACQSAGLPLLLMGGGETGPDLSYSNPLRHEQVAINFPDLQILYVHGGWPFVQEALGVCFRRPNVWMMPDVYFPGLPGESDYVLAMRTFLRDRFVFGSNYPYCPLPEILDRYDAFGLPDEVLRGVLADNARRLFSL